MVAISSHRPTLPPLHSLGLPLKPMASTRVPNERAYDNVSRPPYISHWCRSRQISSSSSTTSRSASPPLFDSPSYSRDSTPSTESETSPSSTPVLHVSPLPSSSSTKVQFQPGVNAPPLRFRLEPCTLDEAQAIVYIPPTEALTLTAKAPQSTQHQAQTQQAFLLVGPSLQQFRHPQRQIAKGARVHPYRITPSRRKDHDGMSSRRSSTASALFAPL